MKKLIASLTVLALCFGVAQATESYTASGTAPLTVAIPAEAMGQIVAQSLVYSTVSNTTLTVYRPKRMSTASSAASSSTALAVYTASSNTLVDAYTPTIGTDYVLVLDAGSNGYQLRSITAAPSFSSTTNATVYTLSAAVTVAADSTVYFCDVPDNISIPVLAAENGRQIGPTFTGFRGFPVYLSLPGLAGASSFGGLYTIE